MMYKQELLANGFSDADPSKSGVGLINGVQKELFSGYRFEIWPNDDKGIWENSEYLYIYMFSERFGHLISILFNKENKKIPDTYMPRKLINDDNGCMGMAMTLLNKKNNIMESVIESAANKVVIKDLISALDKLKDPQNIFDFFYEPLLLKLPFIFFMALIESVWFFLFLCKEMKLSNDKILSLSKTDFFKRDLDNWGLEKDIDLVLLSFFSEKYEEVFQSSDN